MNKWREETNLPYRSIPNNLCRSPLTRGWNTTPHSRCGLRVTLQWRAVAEATSASWLRFTSTVIVMWTVDILDMLWWQGHLTFRVFLPKTHNPSLIMRKHQTILILIEGYSTTYLTGSPQKTVKILKTKDSMRNGHGQEEPKAMWCDMVTW